MASTPSSTTTGETGGSSSGGSETPPMQQNGNTVVHVRHDSEKSFNELFSVVKSGAGNQRPLQVPWSMRKLPDSFFRPPSTGSKSSPCHSREPSTDNTLDPMSPGMQSVGSPQPQPQQQQQQQQQPLHSRAHSSPASLQQTLSLAQQQSQQHQQMHLRQPSYDVSSPLDNQMPLPPGWEMAKTPQGQIYFMNHITKTTQWEDPRKQIALQQMPHLNRGQQQQPPPPPQPPQQQPPPPQHQRSNSSGSFDSVGALPQGWDQSVTEEGEIYFINHTTRETTWFDPRIPIQKQSVPIRHPQPQMQQQQQQQQPPPQPPQPGMASGSPLSVEQKRMQDLRLQRLENERRALQQRQAELKRLEMERRAQSQGDMQAAMNQTQEMLMRQSLQENNSAGGGDPFLGANAQQQQQQQQQQQSDLHNRQESADSGVGMGSNFNLGSIPEVDMDNAMDVSTDLDTTLTEATVNTPTAAAAAANAAAGGPGAAAGETNTAPSADLMATLPDEIVGEVLSRDSLTWL